MAKRTIDIPYIVSFEIDRKEKQYQFYDDVEAREKVPTTFKDYYIPAGSPGKVTQVLGKGMYEVRFTLYQDESQHLTVGVYGEQIKSIKQ